MPHRIFVSRTFIEVEPDDCEHRHMGCRRARSWPICPLRHKLSVGASEVPGQSKTKEDCSSSMHSTESEAEDVTTVSSVSSAVDDTSGVLLADDAFLAIEGAKTVSEVLDASTHCFSQIGGRQAAAVLHQVAKLYETEAHTAAAQQLPYDPRYLALVKQLSETCGSADVPRVIMRSVWALGKVGACGSDVDSIVSYLAAVGLPAVKDSIAQDLSNALWGLAKLASGPDGGGRSDQGSKLAGQARKDALAFAKILVSENGRRVESLSDQCLSNNLWAIAKLDLKGGTDNFARACVEQLRSRPPTSIQPQVLANSLWAVARLNLDHAVAVPFCTDVACRALALPGALGAFLSHEISMALWAVAKIARSPLARTAAAASRGRLRAEIVAFADGVGTEACSRIQEFSPQSLSNIAWALASMDLTQRDASRKFLLFAAEVAGPELRTYSPQAIANLCWAFSKLGNSSAVSSFGAYAACQACSPDRIHEFTWQDFASITSALARLGLGEKPEVHALAVWIVGRTCGQCWGISTQALLNIATAAVRLGVAAEHMQPLAWEISEVFRAQAVHLNDVDIRQWQQVQRHCNKSSMRSRPYSGWQ